MTEPPDRSDVTAEAPAPADRPARGRWQVGMRTLFLLILAVASWLGVIRNREQNRALRARLDVLRPLGRELEVDDPRRIAVVQKIEQWMDEERWDLYLPPGSYRLCMATRAVGDDGFPPVMKSVPIRPGTHRLALDQRTGKDSWKALLTCDGSESLAIEEPRTFPGDGATTTDIISISEQFPADRPLILTRHRFEDSSAGGGASAPTPTSRGLMVWIEPVPAALPAR